MRVAVLAHSFPRFAGDTHGPFVKALSEALARLGHEVTALVPFDAELRPDPGSPVRVRSFRYVWPDRLHVLGYSRTLRRDVGMKGLAVLESPFYFWFGERALAALVRAENTELVHAHWLLPNGYIAWKVKQATGVPFAVTLHGSDVFMAERNRFLGEMAKKAVAGAAHVTSCSADLRDRVLRIAGQEHAAKVLLVPNGTDLVPQRTAPVTERLVVAVGRLVDKKGFRYLIDAAPALLAGRPDVSLVIGGGGDLQPELEARVRGLGLEGRVRFTGMLAHDAVLDLVARAEVFVMPSVRDPKGNIDGLPIVVLEAMAAGVPVVATAVAGMPLAVVDGMTGALIPEKDPAAIAAAVGGMLDDRARGRAMGEAGRARVRTELNWDAIARRHDALYRAVAAARPSAAA